MFSRGTQNAGGVGFRMRESMRGTHRLVRARGGLPAGSEQPFELEASWGHPRLGRFLNPLSDQFGVAELTGLVSAGGLCQSALAQGTLEFRYLEGKVLYGFEFGEGEPRLRFEGQKRDIRPWNLHRSHTVCYGEVRQVGSGELVSEVVLRFDLRELPALLTSFRVV